jgi:hypothetical protein
MYVFPSILIKKNPLSPRFDNLTKKFNASLTNEPLYTLLLSGCCIMEVNLGSKYNCSSSFSFFEQTSIFIFKRHNHEKFWLVVKLSEERKLKFGCMGEILIHRFGGVVFSWKNAIFYLVDRVLMILLGWSIIINL